jgi:hypothetical protein
MSMSAAELIAQFKSLPASERAQVAKFVVENDDSWMESPASPSAALRPESFREGMADAQAGRLVDLDTALNEPYSDEA